MFKKLSIYLILLFGVVHLCFVSRLFTQTKDEKYIHSISLNEKRIIDGKTEFKEKGQFPLEWKLYFKAKEGDFAVFYDWNGHEIHCRFRRNKFDVDGDLFAKHLVPGNPYRLKGEWTGYYYYPVDERGRRKVFSELKKMPANPSEFADIHSIPVFKLVEYAEIISDQILY
jgi:hypothetical protein